jgi:hypothetical protein
MFYQNSFLKLTGEFTLLPTIALLLFLYFLLFGTFTIVKCVIILLLWKFDFGITYDLNKFIKTKHNQNSKNNQ